MPVEVMIAESTRQLAKPKVKWSYLFQNKTRSSHFSYIRISNFRTRNKPKVIQYIVEFDDNIYCLINITLGNSSIIFFQIEANFCLTNYNTLPLLEIFAENKSNAQLSDCNNGWTRVKMLFSHITCSIFSVSKQIMHCWFSVMCTYKISVVFHFQRFRMKYYVKKKNSFILCSVYSILKYIWF